MNIITKLKLLNDFFFKLHIPSDNTLLHYYFSRSVEIIATETSESNEFYYHYQHYIDVICEYLIKSNDFKLLTFLIKEDNEVARDLIEELIFIPASIHHEPLPVNEDSLNTKLKQLKTKIAIVNKIHGHLPIELNDLVEAIETFENHQLQRAIIPVFADFILNTWHYAIEDVFPMLQDIIIEDPIAADDAIDTPQPSPIATVDAIAPEQGMFSQLLQNLGHGITYALNRLAFTNHAGVHPVDVDSTDSSPSVVGHIEDLGMMNQGHCG